MFPIVRAYDILNHTNLFLKFLGRQMGCRVKSLSYSLAELKGFLEAMVPCPAHWFLTGR